jgi:hypothetical protein
VRDSLAVSIDRLGGRVAVNDLIDGSRTAGGDIMG